MNTETKNCQNCKKDFTIESEDFNFYEKIKVPPPTWCPECRFVRRMVWRNERALYKRACDLCHKNIISMYPSDAPFPVYCHDCWYADSWNPLSYGVSYDFNRPFFQQMLGLWNRVPHIALWQRNSVNSEFTNWTVESQSVYLSASIVGSQNVFYSKTVDYSKDIVDCYNVKNSERCYENIDGDRNYNCQHVNLSRNCIDSAYLVDCVNCTNCFMSSNLRNKQFFFRNKQLSREEYFGQMAKIKMNTSSARSGLAEEFHNLCQNAIYRLANNVKCVDSTGNNIMASRNCTNCFDVVGSEDLKYGYRTINIKNSMDFSFGGHSELVYEYISDTKNCSGIKFCSNTTGQVYDAEYCSYCQASSNVFGCYGVRNKKYIILNKEYSQEEYEKMIPLIKEHMISMPFVDKKGRVYKYGEFFPMELSPHAYNETLAQEFAPLSKDEALIQGYSWREMETKNTPTTISVGNIPQNIRDIGEGILNEILECSHKESCGKQCSSAFRITPGELQFYQKHDIPLPVLCPNCRYHERLERVLPPKLWHRKCMNEICPNEFETPYAPDRPEKVYCESCYNKEVY